MCGVEYSELVEYLKLKKSELQTNRGHLVMAEVHGQI